MKNCKYCNEEIEDDAIVCKHCGNDLIPRKKPRSIKKRGLGIIALSGLGLIGLYIIYDQFLDDIYMYKTTSQYMAVSAFFVLLSIVGIILLIVALVSTIRRRIKKK